MADRRLVLAGVAAVAVVVVAWWAVKGVKKIAAAVNPVSDKNVFYQGANEVEQAVTGNSVDSIGTGLFNFFHPNDNADINAPVVLTGPSQQRVKPTAAPS